MTSLAIPSVPPPVAANVDGAAPPADPGSRFGDALRESQAQPKATGDGHPSDPDTGPPPRKDADAEVIKQDDKTSAKDAAVLPGMIPAVPVAPVLVRQSAAATGKPPPAAAPSAGIQAAVAGSKPLPPHLVATTAPIAAAPGAKTPLANTPGAKPPAAKPGETESAQPATPDADIATTPPVDDHDVNLSVSDQRGDPKTPPDLGQNAFTAQLVHLAGTHAGSAPAQPPPAPAQPTMQAVPGQPQFAQEAAQHVSWLAGQNIQQAEIQLNPKKLGPIQVEITTHHDRVDVSFAVQHPQTVHALQQTLPQLHDMLAQQGLNLGHASVGQQTPGRQHPAFAQHTGAGGAGRDIGSAQADPPSTWRTLRVAAPGRVDDFA